MKILVSSVHLRACTHMVALAIIPSGKSLAVQAITCLSAMDHISSLPAASHMFESGIVRAWREVWETAGLPTSLITFAAGIAEFLGTSRSRNDA